MPIFPRTYLGDAANIMHGTKHPRTTDLTPITNSDFPDSYGHDALDASRCPMQTPRITARFSLLGAHAKIDQAS